MRGNDAAQQLYESLGFVVTVSRRSLPSDPCKDKIRMTVGSRCHRFREHEPTAGPVTGPAQGVERIGFEIPKSLLTR